METLEFKQMREKERSSLALFRESDGQDLDLQQQETRLRMIWSPVSRPFRWAPPAARCFAGRLAYGSTVFSQLCPRYAGRKPGRRLHNRLCDRLSCSGAASCPGMAAVHHHRLLRRVDHFLDVLGRSRDPTAGRGVGLGRRRNRNPRRRFADDDAGRDCDLASAQGLVRNSP